MPNMCYIVHHEDLVVRKAVQTHFKESRFLGSLKTKNLKNDNFRLLFFQVKVVTFQDKICTFELDFKGVVISW